MKRLKVLATMPVQPCKRNGKRGWRWGQHGKCYLGSGAKALADKQGRAIRASGWTGNEAKQQAGDDSDKTLLEEIVHSCLCTSAQKAKGQPNPLRRDPTRMATLKRRFVAELNRKLNKIKKAIYDLIITEDAFGLSVKEPSIRDFLANASTALAARLPELSSLSFGEPLSEPPRELPGALQGDPCPGELISQEGLDDDRCGHRKIEKGIQKGIRDTQDSLRRNSENQSIANGTMDSARSQFDGDAGEFGLRRDTERADILLRNQRFRFGSTQEKVNQFEEWLKTVLQLHLSSSEAVKDTYWYKFIEEGYQKGAGRAFDDTKQAQRVAAEENPEKWSFYQGGKEQFLRSSFARPESIDKVKLLAGRTFDELKGMSDDMRNRMRRTLLDGLVQGKGVMPIVRDLSKAIDISRDRAKTIVRTELTRTHSEGALDSMEQLGVEKVGAMVEWSTAGYNVCPLCAPMEGVVMTLKEMRGLIPRHPNCFVNPKTYVRTDKGWRSIDSIGVGDWVLTHRARYKQVTQVHRNELECIVVDIVIGDQRLEVTADHPIRTLHGPWTPAKQIHIRDVLEVICWTDDRTYYNAHSDVDKIHINAAQMHKTYNLSVEADESYIVFGGTQNHAQTMGFIVHNCACTPIPANVGEPVDRSRTITVKKGSGEAKSETVEGQTRGKEGVQRAIDKSIAAEIPKTKPRSLDEQKELTRWPGADVRIAKERPVSPLEIKPGEKPSVPLERIPSRVPGEAKPGAKEMTFPYHKDVENIRQTVMAQIKDVTAIEDLEAKIEEAKWIQLGNVTKIDMLAGDWKSGRITKKEYLNQMRELKASSKELDKLENQRRKLLDAYNKKARKICELPTSERIKIEVISEETDAHFNAKLRKAKSFVESVTSRNTEMPREMRATMLADTERSYHEASTGIHCMRWIDVKSFVHEIGHHVESTSKNGTKLARQFLKKRITRSGTADVKLADLNPIYADDEIGNGDGFGKLFGERSIAAYCGKKYADATEIISMGIAELYDNPVHFARTDPDYFNFIISYLRGML